MIVEFDNDRRKAKKRKIIALSDILDTSYFGIANLSSIQVVEAKKINSLSIK